MVREETCPVPSTPEALGGSVPFTEEGKAEHGGSHCRTPKCAPCPAPALSSRVGKTGPRISILDPLLQLRLCAPNPSPHPTPTREGDEIRKPVAISHCRTARCVSHCRTARCSVGTSGMTAPTSSSLPPFLPPFSTNYQ